MKLCWLQMFFFIFAPKPTDLKTPVWPPDHLDDNACKDIFWDRWRSLNLGCTKRSLDHVCKCHVDRCVYIAVLPTFRQVPVYWAYRIHHEESTLLLKQEFLRNIWTWYIPPKIIGDILREKTSDSQKAVWRSSLPITHIASGLVPAKRKHIINKSNCPRKGCIHWVAYNHTSSEGETFDGAAIQDGYQWKQMSVIQLADMLSKTYSSAKRLKTFSDNRKVSNHGLEIFPEKRAFKNYKKPAVGKIPHGREERIIRGSENALEMDERKMYQLGLAAVEQEDSFQIEQDSKDRSERSLDFEVELTGEVLSLSEVAAVPKESWPDSPEKMQKDSSERDIFHRQYDINVSMALSENSREQVKQILGVFRERSSFQKMRPQQDIVPSSLEVIPDEKATEAPTIPLQTEFAQYDDTAKPTLQTTEGLITPEVTSTENLSRSPPMITDNEIQWEPSTMWPNVALHTEYIDHSETTREPWLTPTAEVLDTKSSRINEPQTTDITDNESTIKQKALENERTTQQSATTSLVVAEQGTTVRVQLTECLQTGITEETSAEVLDKETTEETILTSAVTPERSQYGTRTPPNTTNKKEDCTEPSKSSETGEATESTGTTTANVPEETSLESFETKCTEEAQPLPDTSNISDNYTKPTASPEPEETTHGSEETSPLEVHLNPTTNLPELTTRGLQTECSEETTLSATADKREEESETTAALKITTTDEVLGTESTLSLTPEATSQRSDVPELTSAQSFKNPSDTTNNNKKYTEPRTSPEPEKTTRVLETKITKKTSSLPVHLDTTMSLSDFTTKDLETECTEETTETSSGDPSKWPCHGLIHHTPTAFRRCMEKMTAWLKMQKARSHLTPTAGSDHSSTHSNFRSQEASQMTQVRDAVNHKNDLSRKTGDRSHLNDEEDDHFYFFDGKLKIRPKFYVK